MSSHISERLFTMDMPLCVPYVCVSICYECGSVFLYECANVYKCV